MSEEFTFRIPQSADDLTADPPEDPEEAQAYAQFYHVQRISVCSQIDSLIDEAEESFRDDGPKFILAHFDSFFSANKCLNDLSVETRDKAWKKLLTALSKHQTQLVTFFEHFNLSQRKDHQNVLQMLMYLFITMSSYFEDAQNETVISSDAAGVGGRGKKKKTSGGKSKVYVTYRSQMTKTILKIFSLKLDRLFESPTQLSHLVNIVTGFMYKLLEGGTLLRANPQGTIFTDVADTLGEALDKYDHATAYSLKLIELLQSKETLVLSISCLVANNIKSGHNILLGNILQHIKEIDFNAIYKDNAATKSIGTFLIELGKSCPEKMYQNMASLVEFLEQDPYTLRNAVLEVICNIILKMFLSPNTNRDSEIKRKLLGFLFAHIHDVNSYTRSKALQLWSRLAEAGAIPMDKLNIYTRRIVERLDDKSCFVRKNAVHFLTQSIKDNPFTLLRKKDLIKFKEIFAKVQAKNSDKLEEIRERQVRRFEEILKLSKADEGAEEEAENESDMSADSNKENEEDLDTEPASGDVRPKSKRKSGELIGVETIAAKRQRMVDEINDMATQWLDLEEDLTKFWRREGDKLDLGDSLPEDIPQDSVEEGFKFFRTLLHQRQFEKALRVLISLKGMYPGERLFAFRQQQQERDELDDEDNQESMSQQLDELFDLKDHVFLSSITNFSGDFFKKLPYELDLARLVFLAPLIDYGKSNLEAGESAGNKNDDCLREFLQKHSQEIESDESDIARLETFLVSVHDILGRIQQGEIFINMLSEAVPKICQLLQSKNVADVQEAITFFKFAFKLDLANAIIGVQRMLKLIFTKEKAVKDKLMEAFTDIYLNESETANDPENDDEVEEEEELPNMKRVAFKEVRKLSSMILKLNQGELICAEMLIQDLYKNNKFNQMHLQVLWERYSMKLSNTNEDEARVALIIIGMLASAQPSIVQNESNLASMIQISLVERDSDYRLVADTCEVLIRSYKMPSTESGEQFCKLAHDHPLFERLKLLLIDSLTNTANNYWNRMAWGIIKVIYFYANKPDYIIADIVQNTFRKICALAKGGNASLDLATGSTLAPSSQLSNDSEMVPSSQATNASEYPEYSVIDATVLARFMIILGEVAMNLLIHLDLHLMREIKIRQHITDKANEQKKDTLMMKKRAEEAKRKSKRQTLGKSRSTITSLDADDELDEMIGPNSNEDPFQETVTKILNEMVLYGPGMLGKFKEMVEEIASDYSGEKYSLIVRIAASSTLAKFMVLSLKYTREKRSLLGGLLDRVQNWEIRSNTIIAFGDLLVRFPNEFEHFTGKIFSCLNDENFTVRSNALKVLTRLILADMIKPKGHISKVARLITDKDVIIRDTAQLFFIELSKKNNVYIYNFLPDIISNLSGSDGMAEEKFHDMIKFLFELLEKTRNTESLVTKLCVRFRETFDDRAKCDLSFCLAQLQYNERGILNLKNNSVHFIESVSYDTIYDNICSILNTFKKLGPMKPDTKMYIEELENRMKEIRAKGIELQQEEGETATADGGGGEIEGHGAGENGELSDNAADAQMMPPPPPQRSTRNRTDRAQVEEVTAAAPSRARKGRKAVEVTSPDESFTSSRASRSRAPPAKGKAAKAPANTRATRGRRKVVIESDDEDDNDVYDYDGEE